MAVQSLSDRDALLAVAPDDMREALTRECIMRSDIHTCYQRDDGGEFTGKDGVRWTRKGCPRCGGTGRIPLPDAEGHQALERYVLAKPGGSVFLYGPSPTDGIFTAFVRWVGGYGHGDTLEAAVLAALKGGE